MMKILIDARMFGLEHAGIGRYVENLIKNLQGIDKVNNYLILLRSETQNSKLSPRGEAGKAQNYNSKVKTVIVDIPHYSLAEQIQLPGILTKEDFDIAHFPHFNVPIFFNRPFIVTIHDLIKHASRGMETTTRDPILYWLKYAGYRIVFGNAVKRAKKIIVPSQAVKDDLLKNYDIPKDKVRVIYEGADEVFKLKVKSLPAQAGEKLKVILNRYKIKTPYVIYTGSAYPHKNLERLVQAVRQLGSSILKERPKSPAAQEPSSLSLIVVSSRNVFLERLINAVKHYDAADLVRFLGFVPDEDLAVLYKNARAFVFPSLSEGFGLPGLEAMTAGCPVVCSDIPVFHEIYGDAATYFDPYDVNDIAQKIGEVLRFNESIHQSIVDKGLKRANQFSGRKMAEETLEVYKEVSKLA